MVFWEDYLSDEMMGTVAPIVVYWIYSGFYQIFAPLEIYRLHSRKEEEARNLVSHKDVVKGVLLQQALQAVVSVCLFSVTSSATIEKVLQPSLLTQAGQFFIAMIVMDAWQYFVHRYMHHNKFLYRHIHSQHHRLIAPYACGALYNHPLEGLLLDTVGGVISFLLSGMTPRTAVYFFSFATLKTVDDHCGIRLPWNPLHAVFQNNAAYHDIHHQPFGIKFNYSQPFFTIWDKMLGTYMPFVLQKRAEGGFEARPIKKE